MLDSFALTNQFQIMVYKNLTMVELMGKVYQRVSAQMTWLKIFLQPSYFLQQSLKTTLIFCKICGNYNKS